MQEDRVPSSPDDLLGIGERLRNAREAKGLTLAVAETLTRIRATCLAALEEEQVDRLPGAAYARGYLRTYALALGLDPDDLMEAYPGAFSQPHEPIFTSLPTEIPIRPAVPPSLTRRIALYAGGAILVALPGLGLSGYQQLHQCGQPVPKPAPPPRGAAAHPAEQPGPPPAAPPAARPVVRAAPH